MYSVLAGTFVPSSRRHRQIAEHGARYGVRGVGVGTLDFWFESPSPPAALWPGLGWPGPMSCSF